MKFAEVEKIFKSKYINGKIEIQNNSKNGIGEYYQAIIFFDKTSKLYKYNFTNYVDLLQKLKFDIYYYEDLQELKKLKNELENEILENKPDEFFGIIPDISDIKRRLVNVKNRIAEIEKKYILVKKG